MRGQEGASISAIGPSWRDGHIQSALHFTRASAHKVLGRLNQLDDVTYISWTLGGICSQSEADIEYVFWCCRARKMEEDAA